MTNDMNRIHYCNNKTLKVKDIAQHFQITSKPLGLWYEIDGAWLKWVESEMPEWKHQRYTGAFKIEVDLSKMLVLRTKSSVYRFTKKYSETWPGTHFKSINWSKVAEKYSGVEFNPYFRELRFEMDLVWYYGIDVPSGCIWKKDAVKKVICLNGAKLESSIL